MSPTCFEPRVFFPRKTGCICNKVCFTSIGVSILLGNNRISFFVGLCCIILFRSLSSSISPIASLPVPLFVFYAYFGFDTVLVFCQFLFVSLDMYFHYYYYNYYFGGSGSGSSSSSKNRSYRKFDASKNLPHGSILMALKYFITRRHTPCLTGEREGSLYS